MENGAISDGQISASSEYGNNYAAHHGRLNFAESGSKMGAWTARQSDLNQWLQIDLLNNKTTVTRVATQGRNAVGHWISQWVTKYKLQYSDDGVTFQYYKDEGQNNATVKFPSLSLMSWCLLRPEEFRGSGSGKR